MNKYRILALALSAMIASSVITGCSSEKNSDNLLDKDNPTTITIWHYYNGVQLINFDEAVNEFNNTIGMEKGIIVEAYSKNSISELADSVIASVKKDSGAEEAPDIFATYAETAYVLDHLDALADMRKYFTDEEISQYVDEYINEGVLSNDNSLKIFPTAKSTEVMMMNYTDWEKFAEKTGVTTDDLKTWEGLALTAEKYYSYTDALTPEIPNDGKAFFGRDSIANYMNIGAAQLGNAFITTDSENNPVLNADKDTLKRLWDNYYVPYVKGYYTAQGRFRSDDAKTGAVIALICSTTGSAYYPSEVTINDDYTYPIENIVLPVPNFEGTDPYIVQQGAGMSVIKSDEKSEYASSVFLKWFTEEERNINFTVYSGYMPVKKSAVDFEKIKDIDKKSEDKLSDTLSKTIELAINETNTYKLYTMPAFDKSAEIRDYLEKGIQDCAQNDYAAISERIQNGEDRDSVLAEYTSDEAFEKWYNTFKTSLENIFNE
ncbi:MAG: extracellular solute-binding protein [Oscillospiraceae bacterium]|nr:extracellular solute-binding protein [Oscillospiraceae bacterium]